MSSLKPTEAVPYSANLESSPSAQEGFSGAPGLQGHPLPITDFSAASLAEDSAPSHPDKQIGDVSPGRIDQEIQTEDTQAQGHVPERPSDTVTHSYARRDDYPRDDYTPGASESPTFVEREAARKFISSLKGPVMRNQCPHISSPFCSVRARTYSILLTI